jgi:hypothetical protein
VEKRLKFPLFADAFSCGSRHSLLACRRVQGELPRFYGLVNDHSQTVVEWFLDEYEAEATLRAVLADEPEWIDSVRIAVFDFAKPAIRLPLNFN